MKKTILIFLISAWASAAQAYPWMFFRQEKSGASLSLDGHVSYFADQGRASLFAGAEFEFYSSRADVNMAYVYSFLEDRGYFRLSSLAAVFPFISDKWTMTLGFRDTLWSEADRYWNYGLWQPRYMLDVFRPEQMGLPGFYFNYEEGPSSLLILASYFYIPDVIIYPRLESGRITSENPFFINAFSDFQWDMKELKLFELRRFFKPVIAVQLKRFLKKSNISLSYAYKPMNQFQYAVSLSPIDLSAKGRASQLSVKDFNYFIRAHHLASLEAEAAVSEGLSLFASLFYEKPERTELEENWISDDVEPHVTISLLAYFQENMGEDSQTLFTLGWTKTIEKDSEFSGANAFTEDLEDVFGRSFNWKEAVSASIEYQNKSLYQGFLFRFRAGHALDNGFYALAVENYLNFSSNMQFYLSGDFLFRFSSEAALSGSSSISKYKDLSRLLAGAKYVF